MNAPSFQFCQRSFSARSWIFGAISLWVLSALSALALPQTITPTQPTLIDRTIFSQPFFARATSDSGLPIRYSIVEGLQIADINSESGLIVLTELMAGRVTVQYDQEGDATYDPAVPVQQSFWVRAPQTIFASPPLVDPVFLGDTVALNASASSGRPVTFEIVSGANRAHLTDNSADTQRLNGILHPYLPLGDPNYPGGAGTVRIRVSQRGFLDAGCGLADPDCQRWLPADDVFIDVTILPAPLSVAFDQPPHPITFGDYPFSVSASATAVHPWEGVFTVASPISFSIFSGPAAVLPSGNEVAVLGMGQILVQASSFPYDVNGDSVPDFQFSSVLQAYLSETVNTSAGAQFLDQWTWRHPEGGLPGFGDVEYSGGWHVAVGDAGRIAYSSSGEEGTWTVRDSASTGIVTDLRGVAHGSGRWVAVGADGRVYQSLNPGGAWAAAPDFAGAVSWLSVDFAGGRFLASGVNGTLATSTDGLAWTAYTVASVSSIALNAVAYGPPGLWVAVGSHGSVLTSPNGLPGSWTVRQSGTVHDLHDVTFAPGAGLFLAVGGTSGGTAQPAGTLLTSADGVTWSARASSATGMLLSVREALLPAGPLDEVTDFRAIVAAGEDGLVMTSVDGILWTQRSSRFQTSVRGLVFGRGFFVAVGDNFSIFTTPTGTAWTLIEANTRESLRAVAGQGSELVAVGDSGLILRSTDGGESWAAVPSGTAADLRGVVLSGSSYVAVGGAGLGRTVLRSVDGGSSWAAAPGVPGGSPLNDLVVVDGALVAVGADFSVLRSVDGGLNWSVVTFGDAGGAVSLNALTYASGIGTFVAVGDRGTVLISPDGLNWSIRPSGTMEDLLDVTYSPEIGLLVAVGRHGAVFTSTYGDQWVKRVSGSVRDIHAITYQPDAVAANGGTFVAVGELFQVLSSRDGVEWNVQLSGSRNTLFGLSVVNGLFVAVGQFQSILTSQAALPTGLDAWAQSSLLFDGEDLNDVIFANNMFVAVGRDGTILYSEDGERWFPAAVPATTQDVRGVAFGNGWFVAVAGTDIIKSANGRDWILDSTWLLPFWAITYGKSAFVAVGEQSQILRGNVDPTNPQEIRWVLGDAPVSTSAPNLYTVAFGNNMYVAAGQVATVPNLLCEATGEVANYDMSTIFYSFDGVNWRLRLAPIYGYLPNGCPIYEQHDIRHIIYGNNMFMFLGDGFLAFRWENTRSPTDTLARDRGDYAFAPNDQQPALLGGVYGDGNGDPRFILVGERGSLLTAQTGYQFDVRFPGTGSALRAAAFGLGQFVAVGDNGRIVVSENGTDWKNAIRSSSAIQNLSGVAYGEGLVVVVDDAGRIFRSDDGRAWLESTPVTADPITAVTYGNGRFIAVTASGRAITSSDGAINWTLRNTETTNALYDLAYYESSLGGSTRRFVAVGASGTVQTSSDGTVWTLRALPAGPGGTIPNLLGVAAGSRAEARADIRLAGIPAAGETLSVNGVVFTFVAGAAGPNQIPLGLTNSETAANVAAVLTSSTDPLVRAASYFAAGIDVRVVASNPGPAGNSIPLASSSAQVSLPATLSGGYDAFVAVGSGGAVYRSPNGTSWLAATVPAGFSTQLSSVAWGNGRYVAVGRFGSVLTSPDGAVWVQRNSGTAQALNDVYFANGAFVASGTEGTVLTSPDGVQWSKRESGTRVALADGAYADGLNVVVGAFGTVVVSGELAVRQGQEILFPEVPNKARDGSPFALNATASSGLPVFYSIVSGGSVASVFGNVVNLAPGQTGSVTVRASQPGNRVYHPAEDVFRTFLVIEPNHSLVVDPVPDQVFGVGTVAVRAVSSVNLPVSFRVLSGPASVLQVQVNASDSVATLSIEGAGQVEVEAFSLGSAGASPADASVVFEVRRAEQSLSFSLPGTAVFFGDPPITLTASASSNLPVTFSVVAGTSATVSGATLNPVSPGSVTIRASQSGNSNFNPAPSVDRTLVIGEAPAGNNWSPALAGSTADLLGVAFTNRGFTAVGSSGTVVTTTTSNLNSWAVRTSGASTYLATAYGEGVYLVLGQGPLGLWSMDGASWSLEALPQDVEIRDLAYGAGRLVAVGANGLVWTAVPGADWEPVETGVTSDLNAVIHVAADGQFVAVGTAGTIGVSPDGRNWAFASVSSADLLDLAYGQASGSGLYVAVGGQSTLLTSSDAMVWAARTSPAAALNSIAYGDGRFIAVGNGGAIFTSGDAATWNSRVSGTVRNLNAIAYAPVGFVAVGDGGTILTSGTILPRQDQTVTFAQPSDTVVNGAPVPLTATASSNLPVAFSVVSGPGFIAGGSLVPTGAGTVEVRAYQPGSDQFHPAVSGIRTLSVAKAPQEIAFSTDPARFFTSYGSPMLDLLGNDGDPDNDTLYLLLDAEAIDANTGFATGLPLSYRVASGPGRLVAGQTGGIGTLHLQIDGEGVLVVEVTQSGNADYHAAAGTFILDVVGRYPSLAFVQPTAGATFTSTSAVFLQVSAIDTGVDTDGTSALVGIEKVEFQANGVPIGTAAQIPGTSLYFLNSWVPGIAGDYDIRAYATDLEGFTTYNLEPVRISVSPAVGQPPVVSLIDPGSLFLGSGVDLRATASDPDGVISQVEFLLNGQVLATLTSAPYRLNWAPPAVGTYVMHARATDNHGNVSVSAPVTVDVVTNDPPVVSMANPASGSQVLVNSTVNLLADATDPDGLVTRVVFLVNGFALGTPVTAEPFQLAWTPAVSGTYTLSAVATDNSGNSTQSPPVTVQVVSTIGQPPTVALSAPATARPNEVVRLLATASDPDGWVAQVSFRVGTTVLGTVPGGSGSYAWDWTPTAIGTYALTATATDNHGNVRTSAVQTVTVVANNPPTVTVTSPGAGAQIPVNTPVAFRAMASDSDGLVAAVQFRVNGAPLGEPVSSEPFEVVWTPAVSGTYVLTAIATDNSGGMATSAPVTVTVTPADAVGPTVTLSAPSSVYRNDVVSLEALASDNGWITEVVFRAGSVVLGRVTDGAGSYILEWQPTAVGNYSITASATDNDGNTTQSAPVLVVVSATPLFDLSITKPATADLGRIRAGSDVLVEAAVANTVRPIQNVQFYVDNVLIGEDAVAPYNVFWTPPAPNQTFSIRVRATDSSGTTVQRTLNVTPQPAVGEVPSLSVSVTADGNITPGSRVLVSAAVYDDDPTGLSLDFFLNGARVTSQVASPYGDAFIIEPTVAEPVFRTYEIRVVATDRDGNSKSVVQAPLYVSDRSVTRPNMVVDTPAAGTSVTAGLSTTIGAKLSGSNQANVQRVIFYANGVEVGSDTTAPYTFDWTPEIMDGMLEEDVYLTAAALLATQAFNYDRDPDTEPVIVTPVQVASPVLVKVKRDTDSTPPTVTLTAPQSGQLFSVGSPVTVSAQAIPADGRAITEVEFFWGASSIGRITSAPYTVNYVPTSPGPSIPIVARAKQNNGVFTDSVATTVRVIVGEVPQVTAFNTDALNFETYVGAPVGFTASASDGRGISSMSLYRNNRLVATDTAAPFSFTDYPPISGAVVYHVTALNLDGNEAKSATITLNVRYPNPDLPGDFAYQSLVDLLFRIPTAAERAFYTDLLLREPATSRESIILDVLEDTQEYAIVRHTLVALHLMTGEWATRPQLEGYLRTAQTFGLMRVVQELLPHFKTRFYASSSIPDTHSTHQEKSALMKLLWDLKYGGQAPEEAVQRMLNLFALYGRDAFLALYATDLGAIGSSFSSLTPVLGIRNPPPDIMTRKADAASLLINLAQARVSGMLVAPSVEQVNALASEETFTRVQLVLASAAYRARFLGIEQGMVDVGSGWRYVEWMQTYAYVGFYPWVYHLEHGWIYLVANRPDSIWYYALDQGWIWTSDGFYPYLFRASDGSLLYYLIGSSPRVLWGGPLGQEVW